MAIAPQYENLMMSSLILWLDHELLKRGGYETVGATFYPMSRPANQGYVFASPYAQLASDTSVAGVTVMTGVYLNGSYILKGQSGLADINYEKGQVYFTGTIPTNPRVSGNFSFKQINTTLLRDSEIKVIFEQKMNLKPKTNANIQFTGLANDEITYPVIFLRNEGGNNKAFAFGGTDETTTNIGCYLFLSSQFELDAIRNIIKDRRYDYIPLFSADQMPYNGLGGFKNNVNFNYTNATASKVLYGSGIFIKDVILTDFSKRGLFQEVGSLTPDCFFGLAEFELCKPRLT
jgi:hypothetical protein